MESWSMRKENNKKKAEIWLHMIDDSPNEFHKTYQMTETNIITPSDTQDNNI